MWNRAELKEKGRQSFKKAYWASVAVALIFMLVSGGFSGGDSNTSNNNNNTENSTQAITANEIYNTAENAAPAGVSFFGGLKLSNQIINGLAQAFALGTGFIIYMFILISGILISLLVIIPIEVGSDRYFMELREKGSSVSSILFSYREKRLNNTVKVMFFRGLYVLLWTLLFVIPGLIKGYEYRMIPYIMAENPDMPKSKAFALSRKMMDGNKFDTFILDLSFLGWLFLSAFTFGILEVFYVSPYRFATYAELYAVLRQDALDKGIADTDELPGFVNNMDYEF